MGSALGSGHFFGAGPAWLRGGGRLPLALALEPRFLGPWSAGLLCSPGTHPTLALPGTGRRPPAGALPLGVNSLPKGFTAQTAVSQTAPRWTAVLPPPTPPPRLALAKALEACILPSPRLLTPVSRGGARCFSQDPRACSPQPRLTSAPLSPALSLQRQPISQAALRPPGSRTALAALHGFEPQGDGLYRQLSRRPWRRGPSAYSVRGGPPALACGVCWLQAHPLPGAGRQARVRVVMAREGPSGPALPP